MAGWIDVIGRALPTLAEGLGGGRRGVEGGFEQAVHALDLRSGAYTRPLLSST